MPKSHIEFSKLIFIITSVVYICQLVAAMVFAWNDKNTDIFTYSIPSSSGIYGAAIIFYLNKAKMENIFKGKIETLKLKLEYEKEYPNTTTDNEVFQELENMYDSKINDALTETLNKDIDIQENL